MAGIVAARFLALPPSVLLAASLALAAVTLAWSRARPFLLYGLVALTGWSNLALRRAVLSPDDLRSLLGDQPQLVVVRGELRETPSVRSYLHAGEPSWRTLGQVEVTALRLNGQPWRTASGRMATTTRGMLTNLFAGQIVEINGVAAQPKLGAAPGTFDYRAYLQNLQIYYQLQADSEQDWQIVSSPARAPVADRFRAWGCAALARGLPVEDESLRLEWALTLGWKAALTDQVSEPFVRASTYHIFAVDGLRMAIVFGIFFELLRALGVGRATSGLVVMPVVWCYVALTGWPASAIRASVMLSVVVIGWVLKRPSDLINSLFAAALIILTWQPQQLFQAGFQLSFFVVLCIILILPPLRELYHQLVRPDPLLPDELRRRWQRALGGWPFNRIADLALVSLAAWLGSLPLAAYYFHVLTPVSTPANVLAVPLCSLVLMSNLASLLLTGWFPGAAELFNHAGWGLMECIRVTSLWFARWPAAYYYVPMPSLFTTGLYYTVLAGAVSSWLFKARFRAWKLSVLGVLLAVWCVRCWQVCTTPSLSILALESGTAIFYDAPGLARDLLVDCGASNSVQSVTQPFLRAQGVNRLAGLLLTQGQSRQIGGAPLVADSFGVKLVYVSSVRFRSPVYRQVVEEFSRISGRLQVLECNDRVGPWTVLHPGPADHFSQADDNALVLYGIIGGTRILLLSELGRAGQEALMERAPDLRADIVIAGLPTTGEPLCDALLEAVQPRLIVVTDAEYPAAQRASAKLCERLGRRNIPVIYTRLAGSATIELGKDKWSLRTMSGDRLDHRGPVWVTRVLPPSSQ